MSMSVPSTSTTSGTPVSFVVKRTFVELPGAEGEQITEPACRKPNRRSTAPALLCMSGDQTPSTCDDDDSDEEDIEASVTRMVSFVSSADSDDYIGAKPPVTRTVSYVSSADSDDFIGAPPLNMSIEWSAAQSLDLDSACHSVDTKAEIPWAPCSSSASTVSSSSQNPWAPCSSSDSRLSSGSSQLWMPCSSNGSSYEELHFVPEDSADAENHTTVMVRNVASGLCQLDFVQQLKQRGYNGEFDFVYLPMNLRDTGCFGYAFVNFTSHAVAAHFTRQLVALKHDDKEWRAVWSTCQGVAANVERYRDSPLMHHSVPEDCKPALYDERGMRVQFPAPRKTISRPRIHKTKEGTDLEGSTSSKHGMKSKGGRLWPSMSKMSANAAHMMGHLRRVANRR